MDKMPRELRLAGKEEGEEAMPREAYSLHRYTSGPLLLHSWPRFCHFFLAFQPQPLIRTPHFHSPHSCQGDFFLRAALAAYGSPQSRGGINWNCSCRPTPQPQQRWIRAASANYPTAHGNARSLTHRARPGIKPESS